MKDKLQYLWIIILAVVSYLLYRKHQDLQEAIIEIELGKNLQNLKKVRARTSVTDKEYQDAKAKYQSAVDKYRAYTKSSSQK